MANWEVCGIKLAARIAVANAIIKKKANFLDLKIPYKTAAKLFFICFSAGSCPNLEIHPSWAVSFIILRRVLDV